MDSRSHQFHFAWYDIPISPWKGKSIQVKSIQLKVKCENCSLTLWYQVWRLISRLYILPPDCLCALSTGRKAYSHPAISAHWFYRTHCNLCPTRGSFTLEWSEACEGKVPFPSHNVETMSQYWEGKNMIFLWKSCTKRVLKPHSDIGKAPLSNHCATSLSVN